MLATLEAQAGQDATKKAYCNKELSETNTQKIEKNRDGDVTSQVIQVSANSAKLKAEVATSQMSLLSGGIPGEMDQLQRQEAATYAKKRPTGEA